MWNNEIFVAELIGTFVLAFGIGAILYYTKSKVFTLKGSSANIFTAVSIGIILIIAIYASVGIEKTWHGQGHGFVNPAAAVMWAVGENDFSIIGESIVGELIGAFIGFVVAKGLIHLAANDKTVWSINVEEDAKVDWRGSIFGEILGSSIFYAGMAAAVFGAAVALGPVFVGLGIMAAILILGQRFALMLNPAIGIVAYLDNFKNLKASNASNVAMKAVSDLVVAGSVGAVYFAVS